MSRHARVPDCTHGVLDRVFDKGQMCYVCGRVPAMGFLYQCVQDCTPETLRDRILLEDPDSIEPVKSSLRLRLECLEMSESVIVAAEGGHYTRAHLEKLIGLKQELQQTILDKLQGSQINDAVMRLAALQNPPNSDGTSNSAPVKDAAPKDCNFRACPACRPYYRERVYISFQAVLAGDFAPMTRASSQLLPTKSLEIMRTIGSTVPALPSARTFGTVPSTLLSASSFPCSNSTVNPQTASSDSSQFTFQTTQSDVDQISADRRPRKRFYSMGRRTSGDIARDLSRVPAFLRPQGLKTAIQSIFRPGRESSSSGSNVTLPLPRTGTVRDLQESRSVREFDVGSLRRVRKQKERNEMRDGTYTVGFEDVEAEEDHSHHNELFLSFEAESESSESDFSVYSCVSEGSEVAVGGGVALREETVQMHTTDLHTVGSLPAKTKLSAYSAAADKDEEHGANGDIGLQDMIAHQM